jgi:hypothetical protein
MFANSPVPLKAPFGRLARSLSEIHRAGQHREEIAFEREKEGLQSRIPAFNWLAHQNVARRPFPSSGHGLGTAPEGVTKGSTQVSTHSIEDQMQIDHQPTSTHAWRPRATQQEEQLFLPRFRPTRPSGHISGIPQFQAASADRSAASPQVLRMEVEG